MFALLSYFLFIKTASTFTSVINVFYSSGNFLFQKLWYSKNIFHFLDHRLILPLLIFFERLETLTNHFLYLLFIFNSIKQILIFPQTISHEHLMLSVKIAKGSNKCHNASIPEIYFRLNITYSFKYSIHQISRSCAA